jgi:lipopolysaccharide transport system ATP-binding protein
MSTVAIRTADLGKMYHIGGEREQFPTLRDSIVRAVKRPLERIRHPGAATHTSEPLWALRHVDLEIPDGEVLGLIGRNGSGKSTLLKVLSRITKPTEGRVELRGRVASLLEVGTGFHPELTGRENITLNGAILGMTRAEIKTKFDDIVEFSEIARFLDTPVKRYSTGMYVRLAFAVAAHLDPEILLVDEVLAVGDTAFQKKCLGKMGDIARGGRTVVFVSHNLTAINRLCDRVVLLDRGSLMMDGDAEVVTAAYIGGSEGEASLGDEYFEGTLTGVLRYDHVRILGGTPVNPLEPIDVEVEGECTRELPAMWLEMAVYHNGVRLLTRRDVSAPQAFPEGRFRCHYTLPARFLRPGEYTLGLHAYRDGGREHLIGRNLLSFRVLETYDAEYEPENTGIVNLPGYGRRETL